MELLLGLIPTHAGKTHQRHQLHDWLGAHPHSRGENQWQRDVSEKTAGSSPLTRGKPRIAGYRHCWRGLIPTHAGKTQWRTPAYGRREAHPHSRGENCDAEDFREALNGSSPLTRGKRDRLAGRGYRRGLIPTHAGKTGRM